MRQVEQRVRVTLSNAKGGTIADGVAKVLDQLIASG